MKFKTEVRDNILNGYCYGYHEKIQVQVFGDWQGWSGHCSRYIEFPGPIASFFGATYNKRLRRAIKECKQDILSSYYMYKDTQDITHEVLGEVNG